MNEAIRRQAQRGLYLIEDAMLELLYNARLAGRDDGWVKNGDIHNELGMPIPEKGKIGGTNFTMVILTALAKDGRVESKKAGNIRLWRLTDTEFEKWQATNAA